VFHIFTFYVDFYCVLTGQRQKYTHSVQPRRRANTLDIPRGVTLGGVSLLILNVRYRTHTISSPPFWENTIECNGSLTALSVAALRSTMEHSDPTGNV
jgi:hypothetical protein